MYQKLINKLATENMSVYKLSQKTGIANNHLYRALGGHMTLFPGWKKRIAKALDCTVEELFSDDNSEVLSDE